MQIALVTVLLFMLAVAVFALQNAAAVKINLLFWSFQVSLSLLIIGSAFTGALFSFILSLFKRRRWAEGRPQKERPAALFSDQAGPRDGRENNGAKDLAD